MKTAYDAQNLIDAQLVCDLLHSAGIPARVSGAGLLGAAAYAADAERDAPGVAA